jgi:hypothetical protein
MNTSNFGEINDDDWLAYSDEDLEIPNSNNNQYLESNQVLIKFNSNSLITQENSPISNTTTSSNTCKLYLIFREETINREAN